MLDTLTALDYHLFRLVNESLSNHYLDVLMYVLTWLGSVPFTIVFGVATVFVDKSWGRKVVLTLIAVGTIFEVLKVVLDRTRPYLAHSVVLPFPPDWFADPSFPSGHSAFAFGMSFLLSQRYAKLKLVFYGLACTIGFSRMYLGMHYPSDVLAGAALGWTMPLLIDRFCFSRVQNEKQSAPYQ